MDELDEFMKVKERAEVLKEREETRQAVKRMVEVIAEAASYISNRTSRSILCSYSIFRACMQWTDRITADLVTQSYGKRIRLLKENFVKAMRSFDLSLNVEALKGIHFLGGYQQRLVAIGSDW